jgi:hypothetical protein
MDQINISTALKRLQRIIFSLTVVEKNNFRRWVGNQETESGKNTKYIQLFDCINDSWNETQREFKSANIRLPRKSTLRLHPKMNPQDMERIFWEKFKSRFQLRAFATEKETDKLANYLFDQILQCIRNLQNEPHNRRDLSLMLADIHVLFHKELFEECASMVKNAKKIAATSEAWQYMLELLRIERRLLAARKGLDSNKLLHPIYQEEQQVLQYLSASTSLFDLFQQTFVITQGKTTLDTEPLVKEKINTQLHYLVNKQELRENVFELQFYHHAIIANLLQLKRDTSFLEFLNQSGLGAIQHQYEEIIRLYDLFPFQKLEDPNKYKLNVINYLNYSFAIGKLVDTTPFDAILSEMDPSEPDYLRLVIIVQLLQLISKRDFTQAQKFLEEKNVWDLVQKFGNSIPASRRQTIVYNAGTVYFVREELPKALAWYDLNHQDESPSGFRTVLMINELMYLLVRFELGKTHVHRHKRPLLDTFERLLGKEAIKQSDSFERFLFQSLLRVLETNDNSVKLRQTAAELLEEGTILLKEHPTLSHFSLYLAWLESKALGRPIRSLVDKYM